MGSTASRRARPRAWLRAVAWLITTRSHPRAGATTARVARDLAARMDHHEGTVIYGLDTTAERLQLSRATVKRHVAILRELGALAWHIHGSRRNLHKPDRPYTATGTVYAATVPPAYDHAHGHRTTGHGYTARLIGLTSTARARMAAAAVAATRPRSEAAPPPHRGRTILPSPRRTDPNTPTATRSHRPRHAPPSLNTPTPPFGSRSINGFKNTRTPPNTATTAAPSTATTINHPGTGIRSPLRVARDIRIAATVRARVTWTAHESLRRLAWALRPLIDRGLDATRIAGELTAWHLDDWRPRHPAAFITARLRREAALDAQHDAERAAAVHPTSNPAWRACINRLFPPPADPTDAPPRTTEARRAARAAGRHDLVRVIEHLEHDFTDALDLYGTDLTRRASNLAGSPTIHWHTH
ncbi:cell wall protein [Embleya sp. NPDC020630]|uniref:cell wall protein n=1 Tax=Embleya sp. NPDC020630 TaxID=3363979 RepID=UPI0037AD682E